MTILLSQLAVRPVLKSMAILQIFAVANVALLGICAYVVTPDVKAHVQQAVVERQNIELLRRTLPGPVLADAVRD